MTTISESQVAAKRAQLNTEAADVDRLLADCVANKSYSGFDALQARVDQLAEDRAEIDRQDAVSKAVAGTRWDSSVVPPPTPGHSRMSPRRR